MAATLIHALIALGPVLSGKPDPNWPTPTSLSVGMVDATLVGAESSTEEPASAFVVGWKDPFLYVVTAGHVLEDRPKGLVAQKVRVRFAPELCPDPLDANPTPVHLNREHDFAVLAVALPTGCASNVPHLRRLRMSPLAAASSENLLKQQRVVVLGRSAEGAIAPVRDIPIRGTTPARDIVLDTSKIAKQLSGSPVFSETGDLVGVVVGGGEKEGMAVSYDLVRSELAAANVPRDFAGDVASLWLIGAPTGSTLRVDRGPPEPIREIMELAPGTGRSITVENAGAFEPATTTVDLVNDTVIRRCVNLTTPGARRFASVRWPLFWSSVGVSLIGIATGIVAWRTHQEFDAMPSRALYDDVAMENTAADALMVTGALGLTAFGLGHAIWTPRSKSSISECGQY